MINAQFLFVAHVKGQVEGNKFDKVKLSDGIRVISLKNETGKDDFLESGFVPEKTKVDCELKLSSNKEVATVSLLSMKPIKV